MQTPLTDRIVEFTANFSWSEAPGLAVANAKLAILDCLGAALLASVREAGSAVRNFAHRHAGRGECTVFGVGGGFDPRDAALLNGTLAHALDFDDRNHSSTYSLAAAFAACEERKARGADLLNGFIVGREIRAGLDGLFAARGQGIGPGARGWHSNGILGPISSACAAAAVRRETPEFIRRAIGLAAGSCGALTRDGGTMAKPFRVGHAASTGLTCVYLANGGFTADGAAIEGERGLLEALGPIPAGVVTELGEHLGSDFDLARPIRAKQFPSCTATHGAIEAMRRLRASRQFEPEEVEFICCDLRRFPLLRLRPETAFEARFSMPFCLAMASLDRDLGADAFTEEAIRDPQVVEIMRRIRDDTDDHRLQVKLKSGETLSERISRPSDLSTREEIEKKFRLCASQVLGEVAAGRVISVVQELEDVEIGDVTHSLVPLSAGGG